MDPITLKKALTHLKKDTRLRALIKNHPKPDFNRAHRGLRAFPALIRAIVYQQLSGKAAQTILNRFLDIYKGNYPTPERLLKTPTRKIRSSGISGQKAGYLMDLARKFKDGTVNPRKFRFMSDKEVYEHVVSVKGIGQWTTDMFLMFTLQRPDVLPTGDFGIQKGFRKLFKLRSLPSPETMQRLAKPWRPYRTAACWYLWRLSDKNNSNR